MQAQIITDRQLWNDFIATSELCNITQTYEWGELMSQKHSEFLPVGVVQDDGSLCAVMLVLISSVPGLHVPYFYAPRGPIVADPASPAMTILLNFVRAEAHKRGICMLKIEPGVASDNEHWLLTLKRYGFRTIPYAHHLRHEWVTDIRAEEDALLASMHKKTRQYIRTAGRTDVVVRLGQGQADIDAFYDLYCQTGERSEFMILDKAYYERFLRLYGDHAALLVAERQGRVIAAAIVAYLGVWSWNMYEGASEESRELRINYLLQWKRILWAKTHGCSYFNSRGIPDVLEEGQELYGVYNFKRGFGGFAMRSLETHDLVYRPMLYRIYRMMLDAKHWYEQRKAAQKAEAERKAAEKKRAERAAAQKAGELEKVIPNTPEIQELRQAAKSGAQQSGQKQGRKQKQKQGTQDQSGQNQQKQGSQKQQQESQQQSSQKQSAQQQSGQNQQRGQNQKKKGSQKREQIPAAEAPVRAMPSIPETPQPSLDGIEPLTPQPVEPSNGNGQKSERKAHKAGDAAESQPQPLREETH